MLGIEVRTATNIKVLWDFEGVMRFAFLYQHLWECALCRYSPLFYGFYANQPQSRSGYQVQLCQKPDIVENI